MHFISWAMPTFYIKEKGSQIGAEKQQEVINQSYKVQITPLVNHSFWGGYRDICTNIPTSRTKVISKTRCGPAAHAWFENFFLS